MQQRLVRCIRARLEGADSIRCALVAFGRADERVAQRVGETVRDGCTEVYRCDWLSTHSIGEYTQRT